MNKDISDVETKFGVRKNFTVEVNGEQKSLMVSTFLYGQIIHQIQKQLDSGDKEYNTVTIVRIGTGKETQFKVLDKDEVKN